MSEVMRISAISEEHIAEELIKRSKDKNIIYLTNDVILNTDSVKLLANYISKQQKENEALGRTLDDEIADNDRLQKELEQEKEKNKKLKNKIKDKIKQIEKEIMQIKNNNTFVHYDILEQTTIRKLEYAKSKLDDLLKEE